MKLAHELQSRAQRIKIAVKAPMNTEADEAEAVEEPAAESKMPQAAPEPEDDEDGENTL